MLPSIMRSLPSPGSASSNSAFPHLRRWLLLELSWTCRWGLGRSCRENVMASRAPSLPSASGTVLALGDEIGWPRGCFPTSSIMLINPPQHTCSSASGVVTSPSPRESLSSHPHRVQSSNPDLGTPGPPLSAPLASIPITPHFVP